MLKNILLLIFGGVTIIALLESTGYADLLDSDMPVPVQCDNSKRLLTTATKGGGLGIDTVTAKKMIEEYKKSCDTTAPYGVYFSKQILDQFFGELHNATGIVVYFAKDNNTTNLIIAPSTADNSIIENENSPVYIGNGFCPDVCGIYNFHTVAAD